MIHTGLTFYINDIHDKESNTWCGLSVDQNEYTANEINATCLECLQHSLQVPNSQRLSKKSEILERIKALTFNKDIQTLLE